MKRYIKAAIMNILDEDIYTQREIAESDYASPEVLEALADVEDQCVEESVMMNPNTPVPTLNRLIKSYDERYSYDNRLLQRIARRTDLEPSTLDTLAIFAVLHPSSFVAIPLAENPTATESVLLTLVNGYDTHAHAVMDPIIKHPNVTLEVLRRLLLVDRGYCGYMDDITKEHRLPDDFLWEFARNGCEYDMRRIANTSYTPSEILEYFIENASDIGFGYIAFDALKNPNLSLDYLCKYYEDHKNSRGVVENPNCPPYILSEAADQLIRESSHSCSIDIVASHPNTPVETLYKIFEAGHDGTVSGGWSGLAKNPSIPDDIASGIAIEGGNYVKELLAMNPNVAPEILGSMVKCRVEIRKALAKNPNTPTKALLKLAKDKSYQVVWAVAENPNLPEEVFAYLLHSDDCPNWILDKQLKRFPQYRSNGR